ncbi:putative threonine aldolase [Pavlovales sp. CCMP2436]|nr:putative threonine aldolase [Pavlovales sp. CCMP2436]
MIDLRSDTVTKPCAGMRAAMASAEVGDDVFGDDMTVKQLESAVAERFGKRAALCLKSWSSTTFDLVVPHSRASPPPDLTITIEQWERGSEYILGDKAHIFLYEQGGGSQLGGAHPRTVPTCADGTLPLDLLAAAVRDDDQHYPITKLICLENTHNKCGGLALPRSYVRSVSDFKNSRGLALHVDGARVWNAMVAQKADGSELGEGVDSIAVCLSKGLGAPAGTHPDQLPFPVAFLKQARRRTTRAEHSNINNLCVLAAAGLYALTHNLERLSEDHEHARALGEGLAGLSGLHVNMDGIQTNLVFFNVTPAAPLDAAALVGACAERGVRFLQFDGSLCRMATHLHHREADVRRTLEVVRQVLEDADADDHNDHAGTGKT